mgnify:CR=1 FL=1
MLLQQLVGAALLRDRFGQVRFDWRRSDGRGFASRLRRSLAAWQQQQTDRQGQRVKHIHRPT